jgi:predicted MPP superfamily phosphohydrolase
MMIFFSIAGALVLALLPHVIWFLSWCVAKISGGYVPYAPFGWSSIALVALFWTLMAWGFYIGRWKMVTNTVGYTHQDIPAEFDGFRIVHISDLHLSTFDGHPERLQKVVDKINSLEPDLVCFTGDLVTVGVSEAEPYTEILRSINAHEGVAAVLGNHDFLIYSIQGRDSVARRAGVQDLDKYIRESLGWKLLRNENITIAREGGSKISILGVDNIQGAGQGFSTINQGNLSEAVSGSDGFRILLSHDPSHWQAEVLGHTDIPLTLSGHTHAAQIRVFGWNPSSLMFNHTDGRYDRGGQTLYVNTGLGCTAPFRLGAPQEITLIQLSSSSR